jgi:hypothetical protein
VRKMREPGGFDPTLDAADEAVRAVGSGEAHPPTAGGSTPEIAAADIAPAPASEHERPDEQKAGRGSRGSHSASPDLSENPRCRRPSS